MSQAVRNLEPVALWNHFADLNAVPRPSKKEERVIEFMMQFGQSLGLETIQDHVGNVIIKKPATPGMESKATIVMQSHLDMVHQKNNDTVFDFDTEGIKMYVDGDLVRAEGTTLGADNGIGVATIMAILSSTDIAHPAIEALFTIDEETGMTGAMGLEGGMLTGKYLLNLDTEDDKEIAVGCAGGIDVTVNKSYTEESVDDSYTSFEINVKGLNGGHSGMQIHEGLGNANKLMNRILYAMNQAADIRLQSINGGSLRNAIPRESKATIFIKNDTNTTATEAFEAIKHAIENEYKHLEANLFIALHPTTAASNNVLPIATQQGLLNAMYTAHNGVFRMSPAIAGLVEASNNIARVTVGAGNIEILCLTRSSVESSKQDVVNALTAAFELMGATVTTSGDYPGWEPIMESAILQVVTDTFRKVNNEEPHVMACHAGLECGILGTNYPEMEMISFGPTIEGAHSPDERVTISSVQKYWKLVLEILKNIPNK